MSGKRKLGKASSRRTVRSKPAAKASSIANELPDLEMLLSTAPTIVYSLSAESQFAATFVSASVKQVLGYEPQEMLGNHHRFQERIHPDDVSRVHTWIKHLEAHGQHSDEYRIRHKDGTYRWLHDVFRLVRNDDGTPRQILGCAVDITGRKKAEAALQASEEKYRQLFDLESDALFMIDNNSGRILEANSAAIALYGYRHNELLALRNTDLSAEPAETARATRERHQAVPIRRHRKKDGTAFTVEITARHCIWAGRDVHIAAIRDITDRERKARELHGLNEQLRTLSARLAQIEEEERKRLAQELHDRVGQSLTALGINLGIARTQLQPTMLPTVAIRLDDSLRLLQQVVADVRNVMTDLRPSVLDDFGLFAALRWYSSQFTARTGISAIVKGDESALRLPPEREIAVFRIAQEALTNVAKHARARHVELSLEETDGIVRLTIADDGAGFKETPSSASEHRCGWGLMSMRERAEASGGRVEVMSRPGQGTRVLVSVPR